MWIAVAAVMLAAAPDAPRRPPAGPPQPPVVQPGAERDWSRPPPGPPEDQQLWRSLKDGAAGATLHLSRVAQCAWRIQYGRYYEALDARRADAVAAAAREELAGAAKAAQGAVPARPGVHVCRQVLLDLDQRIELPREFADGDAVRRDARDCAARMARLAAAVEPAADRLEAALARVDAVLGRTRPAAEPRVAPDDAGAALEGAVR